MIALLALLLAQAPGYGFTPPPGVIIQDEGVAQGRARTLNCVGAGISCTVSAGVATLSASSGGSFAVSTVTVDVKGPVKSFSATVTDAGVSGTSKVPAWQHGAAVGAGTIAFVHAASNFSLSPASVTFSTTAGNLVVVVVGTGQGEAINYQNASVTDSGGSAYTRIVGRGIVSAFNTQVDLWVARKVFAAATVTVSYPTSTLNLAVSVAEYSGSGPLDQVSAVYDATGSSALATIAQTTVHANDFVVAGFAATGGTTFTQTTGNLRTSTSGSQVAAALMDNTNASPASVTNATTLSAATFWEAVAIEIDTGSKSADENEVDVLNCRTTPGTGSFTLYCTSAEGLLFGRYTILYSIG